MKFFLVTLLISISIFGNINNLYCQNDINISGYTQLRYNTLQTNRDLNCLQCDRSWGGDDEFFFRRIRIKFQGWVHPRVFFYIQPDFAASISGSLHYTQLRDAYADIYLNSEKNIRFRIGQSKVTYSFENLQSSQFRIALDRNDALNSAKANERDLGVFLQYSPTYIRERFQYLVRNLKGSGDYGMISIGIYNGQTANRPNNGHHHIVGRFTYPAKINEQYLEFGIQAYRGNYTINTNQTIDKTFLEKRIGYHFIVYPQPFGFQMEFNNGIGPEFNNGNIENNNLTGGYLQTMYIVNINKFKFIPFFKWHYYKGGKKHEIDATSYKVNEQEIGIEWHFNRNIELVTQYTFSDRRFENFILPNNRQAGRLLRLQLQVNF